MVPSLVERLKAYLFPGGDAAARAVSVIRTTQSGDIRSSATSAWKTFSADEVVDTTRSRFSWQAKMGTGLSSVLVTDAYEDGHGRVVVRKGPLTLAHVTGPHADQGELQRYLSYISYCPSMILNNPFLDFAAINLDTLRIRDTHDATGTWVDLHLDVDGRPLAVRGVRPMMVGKRVIPTDWSAIGSDPQVWNGMRICRHLEAAWHPPDGEFVYVRIDVLSLSIIPTISAARLSQELMCGEPCGSRT